MRTILPVLLLVAASAATVLSPPRAAGGRAATEGLLGAPFAAALERYGPPDRGDGTTGFIDWRWLDDAGGFLRIATHQDVVIGVDTSNRKGEVRVRGVPATGAYPGQRVAELLERMGNPTRVSAAPVRSAGTSVPGVPGIVADARIWFGELHLRVAAGRVLGTEPPAAKVHGPR